MTTIAYKDGIFAYDSYYTAGGIVTDHNAEKKKVVEGVTFFMTGTVGDEEMLIRAYFGEPAMGHEPDVGAFVVDNGQFFLISFDGERFWRSPLDTKNHYALGSGGDFALAAMDMGADAVKAVKMAMHRDVFSGGRVRTHRAFAEPKLRLSKRIEKNQK